jgi:hypothetical protein
VSDWPLAAETLFIEADPEAPPTRRNLVAAARSGEGLFTMPLRTFINANRQSLRFTPSGGRFSPRGPLGIGDASLGRKDFF